MFPDEARLSAQLSHSNCVQVFDIGVGDSAFFIVMEFVDGANLKAIIEHIKKTGRDFPVEAAVYIALAAYYVGQPNPQPAVLGVLLALVGSMSVSYVRARAQSLGFKCDSGLFARPERIVATIVGLVFGGWVLFIVIWALAILTNLTALQRVIEVWRQARALRAEPIAIATPAPVVAAEPASPTRQRTAKQKLARQSEL